MNGIPGFRSHPVFKYCKRNLYGLLLTLLVLLAFLLRLYLSLKEPYLHDWDERFHALVARNMMDHPFKPMLKANPVIYQDPFAWCCNHIWLHKQPLFLWQMALSMKIFGVAEWAMRLPSILMGSLMVLFLYRITYLFTHNKKISLLSALLLCFSHFHLEMITGIKGMDHNDVAMGFYTLASFWAYAEYTRSPRWYWVVLIGLFAGGAILNKWLVGLFVFLCWGINLLLSLSRSVQKREILHFTGALIVCCVTFLPWQFYILGRWPAEANFVYDFNRRHITEVLEGHKGTIFYYAAAFAKYFSYLWFFSYLGILSALREKATDKKLMIAMSGGFIFVFCFLSFFVRTKVESHFFFVAPYFMIFIAMGLYELIVKFNKWHLTLFMVLVTVAFSFDPVLFDEHFSSRNLERERKIHNASIYKELPGILPDAYRVVINLSPYEDIDLMFYNKNVTAYNWWFNEADLKELEKKRIHIAAFKDHDGFILPEYVKQYPYLFIIDRQLK